MPTEDVLIVNDNVDTREILSTVIQHRFSIPTRIAKDGIDALKELSKKRPRLIVLDLMMPNLDGFEVLRCLQSWQEIQDVPVIVVTASDFEDLSFMTNRYPVYFIRDGFSAKEFLNMVQPVLS